MFTLEHVCARACVRASELEAMSRYISWKSRERSVDVDEVNLTVSEQVHLGHKKLFDI